VGTLLLALSVALAIAVSAWFLVAVPFVLTAMFGAWLGLTIRQTWDAVQTSDDPGGGPAGMSP
jgi:hypothetical protein